MQRWDARALRLYSQEIVGQAEGRDVNSDTAYRLIRLKIDRDDRVHKRHQAAGDHGTKHAQQDILGGERGHHAHVGTGEHHTFHGDIDHAAAL